MTQETISRAELDADQARQEATFTTQVYQLAAGLQDQITQLRTEMHQMRTERTGRHAPNADRAA